MFDKKNKKINFKTSVIVIQVCSESRRDWLVADTVSGFKTSKQNPSSKIYLPTVAYPEGGTWVNVPPVMD